MMEYWLQADRIIVDATVAFPATLILGPIGFDMNNQEHADTVAAMDGTWVEDTGGNMCVGWQYNGTAWTPPVASIERTPTVDFISPREFVDLLTPAEFRKVKVLRDATSAAGEAIDQAWYSAELAGEVNMLSAKLPAMLDIMVAEGCIAASRKDEILNKQPPEAE